MDTSALKGRKILILFLFPSLIYVPIAGLTNPVLGFVYATLMFLLYRGNRFAKWILALIFLLMSVIFFLVLAFGIAIGSLSTNLFVISTFNNSYISRLGAAICLMLTLIYFSCFALVLFKNNSVKAFLRFQLTV